MSALCMSVAQMALSMDHDRRSGITLQQTQAEIDRAPANVKKIARMVTWYVYEVNDDLSQSPGRVAEQVRQACEASTRGMPL